MSDQSQTLDLVGGCNFRDLGGYPVAGGGTVRRGLVYRSGVLTYLTDGDHAAIAPLGIRTIVDLRRDDEIASEPTHWAGPVQKLSWQLDESIASSQRGAAWEQVATGPELRAWLIGSYPTMQDWLVRPLRGLFGALLDDQTPLVFHCAAGKDRTGFCAAIILGLAGVDEDTILADFALTDTAVDLYAFTRVHRAARMGLTDGEHPFEKMAPDVRDALMRADPAYLKAALDSVAERHGSIAGYAQAALGLDEAQIAAIRERLVEG
ncbi:tyrosine-protein phosphatase [Novosphingobium sp. MMS21-SN21R]|uniref:tyrosine-protein phosphatase n=1 Tax=Novosphingobium sp. MMS21-SN21R TaxID=2969298 RepID=UPI0028876673|nr:tyrosine-protein phosphatase [Novosphingobium sp. MMS21-SN21R]MDT0509589.1 tyrosine-protein phosphatase [Novosphingobium sp. MMS21-SN21R]